VNLLMVTPHLPPHQAANALLPHQLGQALAERGHTTRFLTFGADGGRPGTAYVRRRAGRLRPTRLPQLLEAAETWWKARPLVRASELAHIHSSTWMNQVAARLCLRHRRPYVLTHYGTEIWHHDRRDERFRRFNRDAAHVAFYSRALLDRARELELPLRQASVVYPPVGDAFALRSPAARDLLRARLLPPEGALLVNVKRLHPLADQATLLDAMHRVRLRRPDALLLIAGAGEAEAGLKARAARLGLDGSVRFLGLVANEQVAELLAAADLFVLSSLLEATPTVALEALASGTPVVSTDNPGGKELAGVFGDDVTVVPMRDPAALAGAILASLAAPRRTRPATAGLIASRFRLASVAERYLQLYREALQG